MVLGDKSVDQDHWLVNEAVFIRSEGRLLVPFDGSIAVASRVSRDRAQSRTGCVIRRSRLLMIPFVRKEDSR